MDGSEPGLDDDALMAAFAMNDQTAFSKLYSRHRSRLYGYLYRHLHDRPLCDELFQDVWHKVVQARSEYRAQGQFTAWLLRIAQHRLEDHWRAVRHRPSAPADAQDRLDVLSTTTTPESEHSDFMQRRALRLALQTLPSEQRTVLLLRLEQELSLEAIADITGSSRETVKSRLRYGMDKLRQVLVR